MRASTQALTQALLESTVTIDYRVMLAHDLVKAQIFQLIACAWPTGNLEARVKNWHDYMQYTVIYSSIAIAISYSKSCCAQLVATILLYSYAPIILKSISVLLVDGGRRLKLLTAKKSPQRIEWTKIYFTHLKSSLQSNSSGGIVNIKILYSHSYIYIIDHNDT